MKEMKRIATIVLTVLLAVSMLNLTVFADTATQEGRIKLSLQSDALVKENVEFSVYQLATFDLSGGKYTNIKVNEEFTSQKEAILAVAGKESNSAQAQSLAASLKAYVKTTASISPVATLTTTAAGAAETTALAYGYYLVVQTGQPTGYNYVTNQPVLIPVVADENIASIKTGAADVDKKIVESTEDYTSGVVKNDVNIGDTITYRVTGGVPTYSSDAVDIYYAITDTMSAGLTYTEGQTVKVMGKTADGTNVEITGFTTSSVTDNSFTVSKTFDTAADIAQYQEIYFFYTAKLNENAVIGAANSNVGNPNTVNLTYTNGSETTDRYTTPNHEVTTYTYGISVQKVDQADTAKNLAGAQFTLTKQDDTTPLASFAYDAEGNISTTVATGATETVENNRIYFKGLDAGTYTLTETVAPEGYNLLGAPVTIVITPASDLNGTCTVTAAMGNGASGSVAGTAASFTSAHDGNMYMNVTIADSQGVVLPGTGGMGTTLFTFGGLALILVAGAGLFFFMRKRKNA